MGSSIEIPFAMGDEVFWIGHSSREDHVTCPECMGTKFLTLIQGNGVQVQIDCACCSRGFDGPYGTVRVVINEHQPTRVTLGAVSIYGKEIRYDIGRGAVEACNLFKDEAECLAACTKKNAEDAISRAEMMTNNLKSKRKDMAWSVHYWQGQVRHFKDDLKRCEDRLQVCKARAEKKGEKVSQ